MTRCEHTPCDDCTWRVLREHFRALTIECLRRFIEDGSDWDGQAGARLAFALEQLDAIEAPPGEP